MEDILDHIDELIAKKLAGELAPGEAEQLDGWLASSAGNRLYFDQMQRIWQTSELGKEALPNPVDLDLALAKTREKIRRSTSTPAGWSVRRFALPAAAVLALVLAAVWFFRHNGDGRSVEWATNTQPMQDTLMDGSVIALNRHSSLTALLDGKKRRVSLNGEAFFHVAKNPDQPFTVAVKTVEITVVGTQFNVDNRSDSTKVIVTVEEGKVKVESGGQVVFLAAGEQAVIDCGSNKILKYGVAPPNSTANIKGWVDHRFVFDDVPLAEVVAVLQKAYDTKITLENPALAQCRLRARFNDEPIDRVMQLIAETFSLTLKQHEGGYRLDGQSCGY